MSLSQALNSFIVIFLLVVVVVIVQSKSLNKLEHVVYNAHQKAMIEKHKSAVQNHSQTFYGVWFAQHWPNSRVPYVISNSFSYQERQTIINTLRYLESVSCFRFKERTCQKNYVEYVQGNSCRSSIGMQGGYQQIMLSREVGCINQPDIMHETMHALGLSHEHQRYNRNNYVQIHMENVSPGNEDNFNLASFNVMRLPYDYYSIMHYPRWQFSKNGRPTLTAKQWGVSLQKNTRLSRIDLIKLRIISNC